MQSTPPLRPPAAVLFDLDGTLVPSEPLHHLSIVEVLAAWDKSLSDEELISYTGWAEGLFWEDLKRTLSLPTETATLIEQRTDAYVHLLEKNALKPLAGVVDFLALLHEHNIPSAIVSSSPRAQIMATLRVSGLAERFSTIVSGHEDAPRGKPAPDPYELAAKALKVATQDCWAFEDSAVGAQSAIAAGCRTWLIPGPDRATPPKVGEHARLSSFLEFLPQAKASFAAIEGTQCS